MKTGTFALLFRKPKNGKGPAAFDVYLQSWMRDERLGGHSGRLRLITPKCLSFKELDGTIDALQMELDEVREQGRRKYAADRRRRRSSPR